MIQGLDTEAISCLLITLCTADIHGATGNDTHAPLLMDLCTLLIMSMREQTDKRHPTEEIISHVAPMLAHSGILLNFFRERATSLTPIPTGHLYDAAEQISIQFGEIPTEDPSLSIDGEVPDPQNPKPILAEIIGHASAIGLLQF